MTPKTWAYLSDVIGDSFKREVDLDESVWRTLPFFVAAFGLAITLLSYISDATRQLSSMWASMLTYLLFAASVAAFAWAFRWFWSVVRPLEYQYPPSDEDLLTYSEGLTNYHRQVGLAGEALDEAVANDMKVFVTGHLAAASGKNSDEQRRPSACPQPGDPLPHDSLRPRNPFGSHFIRGQPYLRGRGDVECQSP